VELRTLESLVQLVLQAGESEASQALKNGLASKNLTYPAFINELAVVLERNPSPLKLSENELVSLLNRIKAKPLRSNEILRKVPQAKRQDLQAALDRYPLLASVLADVSKSLVLVLDNQGNPDFEQDPSKRMAPRERVTLMPGTDVKQLVRTYTGKHDLGGGNFRGWIESEDSGTPVARVSYNGRIWSLNGKDEISLVSLYDR
jgi:hypothetical protein